MSIDLGFPKSGSAIIANFFRKNEKFEIAVRNKVR